MFGRRRRVAPVVQPPAPELSDEQILETIQATLSDLIGSAGSWTLTPRSDDDTDVIFHDLKTTQIAELLTTQLRNQLSVLRGEVTAEPAALPWTPAPISVWADPITGPTTVIAEASVADAVAPDAEMSTDLVTTSGTSVAHASSQRERLVA